MSGREAVEQLVAEARREELVALDVVARALRVSQRKVLRDWRITRQLPVTQVGRHTWLASSLVLRIYFPHRVSGD